MNTIQARIFCPKHGRLQLDDVIIRNGRPHCRKCMSALEFGKIRPRRVVSKTAAKKPRKRRRRKRRKKVAK